MNKWLIPSLLGFIAFVVFATRDRWMPEKVIYVPTQNRSRLRCQRPVQGPRRHLAPPGTLYVVRYFSVRTARGVVGFTPGQEVEMVRGMNDAGKLLVSDGSQKVEVESMDVTDDLDVAARLNRQDQQIQMALQASIQEDSQEYARSRQAEDMRQAAEVARIRTSSSVGGKKALDEPSVAASSFDRARNKAIENGYGRVWVNGYYRSDGAFVNGYWRNY